MWGSKVFAIAIGLIAIVALVNGAPMFYKKNENDKYEPDLIAVSSTVIPLTVYEATAGLGDKNGGGSSAALASLSDEYKLAYMKHLHKKVKTAGVQNPDRLITIQNQGTKRDGVIAKVEST